SMPRFTQSFTSPGPPSPDAGPGEVKLWVNLGMDDGMDEAKLPATLESLGAPAGKVIKALTRPTYGYVYVPEGDAAGFESLNGKAHNDKPLKLERHRPRGQREERRPRHEALPDVPGQARLWVGLGRQEGLDEAGVTAALEAAGAPAGKVLRTDLRPTYAYVFVAEEDVAGFESTHGKPHGEGKTLKVERAKRK
ncbi:DEAD/DEAH box helicase, partial [Corallococcus coralloides]|nr:DEAD/DEAH box helicase [Corallococcus coralloides]